MSARRRIPEEGKRIRHLLALEIDRILEDMEFRKGFLLEVWSKHRDRGPFLDTISTRWGTLGFQELLYLEPDTTTTLDAFYRELHELRFHFMFTEEMPSTLSETYDQYLERLQEVGELALQVLGGRPRQPLVGGEPRVVPKRVEGSVMDSDEVDDGVLDSFKDDEEAEFGGDDDSDELDREE